MRKITVSNFIFFIVTLVPGILQQIAAQVILPDDPVWQDPDQLNMPSPAETVLSEFYDFYENTFLFPGKKATGPALNTNTLGEVPNSSWYTNRHYLYPMSLAEIKRGPDKSTGPSMTGKWQIVAGKSQGITPGFTIKDARGDRYLIKFDPPSNPEMTTGAEIISTKFFYALGYHVPENYLVEFSPEQLELSPGATITTTLGQKKPLTPQMVAEMLELAPKNQAGNYRVIASKFLPGKPVGAFRYHDTRSDDGNDIFPHESRRELRGLRIFCAWLNHDDSRSINTLDMLVNENGKQFVRHHLIDFGSTLGSGSVFAQDPRAGNEYILEFMPSLRSFLTLGFWVRPWAKVRYPDYPSIGKFESGHFDPRKWKTEYPNPAFINCDDEDAFWAAKQVMNFTDEEIRAVVSMGRFSNPQAEKYLANTLIKRRDKIGLAYLHVSGGLDKFRISNKGYLEFEDLLVKYRLATNHQTRMVSWQIFDNQHDQLLEVLSENQFERLSLKIPRSSSEYLAATIATPNVGKVTVLIRNSRDSYKIVGLRRQ